MTIAIWIVCYFYGSCYKWFIAKISQSLLVDFHTLLRLTEAVTGVDGTAVSCFCWEVLEQCGMIVGYVRCQNSAMLGGIDTCTSVCVSRGCFCILTFPGLSWWYSSSFACAWCFTWWERIAYQNKAFLLFPRDQVSFWGPCTEADYVNWCI